MGNRLSAMSVKTGTATNTGDHLPKTELVGELIAFAVVDYDPNNVGDYGVEPQVDVDLLVVSGPHAGTRDSGWRTWGNLARQMGAQGDGTIAARVTSGPGRVKDSKWYGLDFELTPDEVQQVRNAVLQISEQPQPEKAPAQEKAPSNGAAKTKAAPVAAAASGHRSDPPF